MAILPLHQCVYASHLGFSTMRVSTWPRLRATSISGMPAITDKLAQLGAACGHAPIEPAINFHALRHYGHLAPSFITEAIRASAPVYCIAAGNRVVPVAADKLRENLEPSDYKHVALGLFFLKYISNAFEAKRAALLAEDPPAAEDPDKYLAENVFWVPKEARWSPSARQPQAADHWEANR